MKRALIILALALGTAHAESGPRSTRLDLAEFGTAYIDLPSSWSLDKPRLDRIPLPTLVSYPTVIGRDDLIPLIIVYYIDPSKRAESLAFAEKSFAYSAEILRRVGEYEAPKRSSHDGTELWTMRGKDRPPTAGDWPDVFKISFYRDGLTVQGTLRMSRRDPQAETAFQNALLGMKVQVAATTPPPGFRAALPGIMRIDRAVSDLEAIAISPVRLAQFGDSPDEPSCGIQASILFRSPELYEPVLGKIAAKLERSAQRDGRVHSVLYLRATAPFQKGFEGFLSGLLYGGDGQPTAMHPEVVVVFDDVIIIVCGGGSSPLFLETINHALR